MSDVLKSIIAGIAATPFILLFTMGIGLASGLNLHFLLVSVLITNIVAIIFNKNSSYFFNVGPSLVVLMFVYNGSIGMESGQLQTFIIFAIPALFFTILSMIPVDYPLIPNRVIAIITFGIGIVIIVKQLPNAFAYTSLQSDIGFIEEEKSFLAKSTLNNWVQLSLALLIPIITLIGSRFKKGHITLLFASFTSIIIGYLLGYDTTPVNSNNLMFNKSFQLDWVFSPDILLQSISNGITITVLMLISFWSDFSILENEQKRSGVSIKKSLRVVGIGNLVSGLFGVMPTNVSLTDSLSIKAFGGNSWISKIPIILALMLVAITDIPDFNVPIFAFSGVLIYIGILLLIQSWKTLQKLHWIDYIFTVLIGLTIILIDHPTGFFIAMIYALICFLIKKLFKNRG